MRIVTVVERSKVYRRERGKCLDEREESFSSKNQSRLFRTMEMCVHNRRGYNYGPRKQCEQGQGGRKVWAGAGKNRRV